MGVFLSTRLRRWAVVAVLVPSGRYAARQAAGLLERRHGPNPATRVLRRISTAVHDLPTNERTDATSR